MFRHRNELPVEGELPAFDGATTWLNAAPLTPAGLRGRVVLVSFGTYTCINWIRSLPYMRAWADKYAGQGLAVVGVQTPEFDFEGDLDNVGRAMKEMDVRYPVAVDNDYAIWQAFDNHYWPALYFVDTQGRIRHRRFGEGEYEESEMVLQMLLREAGADVDQGLVRLEPDGGEAAADWASLGSPESYVGYGRAVGFASPGGVAPDERHSYSAPTTLHRNQWALSGDWRIGSELAHLNQPGGSIACQFHARDLHLVMGPSLANPSVRFRVRLDGEPPGFAHGVDVDESGNGTADYQRMYQLIRQPGPIGDRLFEIEFLDPRVEAFVFTFG
ncbi:MAG: redoxin domain-containing protein [Chloroflexi bacterium]|nr:MAG: redoxin domain-containing protein [Chloroflexota bacterium]